MPHRRPPIQIPYVISCKIVDKNLPRFWQKWILDRHRKKVNGWTLLFVEISESVNCVWTINFRIFLLKTLIFPLGGCSSSSNVSQKTTTSTDPLRPLSLSLTHTHTQHNDSLSPSPTHAHAHTHTRKLSLYLSLSLTHSLYVSLLQPLHKLGHW